MKLWSAESLFHFGNLFAFAWWLILIFMPKSRLADDWVRSGRSAFMLAIAYWVSLGAFLFTSNEKMDLSSLPAVRQFFASDWGLLAGWIHYLCFDMLVGVQVDARYRERNRFLRAFVLLLTFLMGPLGWSLAWVLDRKRATRRT